MKRTALLIAVALAACAPVPASTEASGLEEPAEPEAPCIVVTPSEVDLGASRVSDDGAHPPTDVITVRNTCAGELVVEAPRLVGVASGNEEPPDPYAQFSVSPVASPRLRQGEVSTLTVTLEPSAAGTHRARVVVPSNDPDQPEVSVFVQGTGLAPEIHVSPEAYDFGAPYIGCETGLPMAITNRGNTDLTVTDVEPFTASVTEFRLDTDPLSNGPLPFTLAPYDAAQGGPIVDVYLDYLPLDTFKDDTYVAFYSDDLRRPELVTTATGTGTKFRDNLDVFEQPIRAATDILFTLDRSGSMEDNLESVASNFDVFVGTLSSLEADYHAAVVVDDSGCVVGPDPYIDSSFSRREAVEAFRTMSDLDFSLSTYGSNTERGFMLTEVALQSENITPPGCNADFYRDDAFLSIVHVSDEPEQSVNSWSYYVSLFQSLKADPEDVVLNAVAGDYPTGCGSSSAGTGYYESTVATGGLFLSICATDWAKGLEDLAMASASRPGRFELTKQPVYQTIEVRIDGIRKAVGWEYDISSNSIRFEPEHVPPAGSTVEVFYQRLPDCSH